MTQLKEQTLMSFRALCETCGLSYSTFMRWQARTERGEPVVQRPGPKPVEPLDLDLLQERIRALEHGPRRSRGTRLLRDEFQQSISRRDFQELVDLARRDARQEKRALLRRVQWHVPNLAWSMDDTELLLHPDQGKVYMHNLQDQATRYKFPPLVGAFACGEEVAGNLASLFEQFGPPLLLKRDNGGNLNHFAVQEVLEEYGVIPLNSPKYYPPYNGAIEHCQLEIKAAMGQMLRYRPPCPLDHLEAYGRAAAHELNHRGRRILGGRDSCEVLFAGKGRARFTKRQRKEVYDKLTRLSDAILDSMPANGPVAAESAWRIAVEQWLLGNDYITIVSHPELSPTFPPEISHN